MYLPTLGDCANIKLLYNIFCQSRITDSPGDTHTEAQDTTSVVVLTNLFSASRREAWGLLQIQKKCTNDITLAKRYEEDGRNGVGSGGGYSRKFDVNISDR